MPTDNWIKVFISHKSEDNQLAYDIRTILENDCTNLRCYVAGTDYGQDWRKTISDELTQSHLLLLLFTSPGKDWDWPLYEVGLFTPRKSEEGLEKKIVFFHAGERRPPPLDHLNGVNVDGDSPKVLEEFLEKFYTTNKIVDVQPPLYPTISKQDLCGKARSISQAFSTANAIPLYPTHRVVLGAPGNTGEPIDNFPDSIPHQFCVESITPHALHLFDLAHPPDVWGEMLKSGHDENWVTELDEQYKRALEGRIAYPTNSTFRGEGDSRNFRAMITRLERAARRIVRVSIIFVPEHSPAVIGGPAFNILRFTTRFQSEVIHRYHGKLAALAEEVGSDKALRSLYGAIIGIEREAEVFGYLTPSNVQAAFSETGDDRQEIGEMFLEWDSIKRKMLGYIENNDVESMVNLLTVMRALNANFMRRISNRHNELIQKDIQRILAENH